MAVSKRLRYEVLQRDDFSCHYCHRDDVRLTVDHVIPVALGGRDDPSNLVAACEPCNAGKAATSPSETLVEEVDAKAVEWAAAIQRAAEIQNSRRDSRDMYAQAFDDAWCEWTFGAKPGMRPPHWRNTVCRWHDAGLETDALVALLDDVMPRGIPNGRIWRYFCGAVSNVLVERQTIAQELLQEGGS